MSSLSLEGAFSLGSWTRLARSSHSELPLPARPQPPQALTSSSAAAAEAERLRRAEWEMRWAHKAGSLAGPTKERPFESPPGSPVPLHPQPGPCFCPHSFRQVLSPELSDYSDSNISR